MLDDISRYDIARFEYDDDFVGKGFEPSPIMMPVRPGRTSKYRLKDHE